MIMPTILLVDDDISVLRAMERGFKIQGVTVKAVSNPVDALDLIKNGERFDAIVSDMEMPRMHGDELCREVRKIEPTIPFILCSGNSQVHARAEECGADAAFDKPVLPSTIKGAIEALIANPAKA